MSFVPTTMTEAEEVLGMFEEVMTVITVANKVFTNKVFNINRRTINKTLRTSSWRKMKMRKRCQALIALRSSTTTTTMNHHQWRRDRCCGGLQRMFLGEQKEPRWKTTKPRLSGEIEIEGSKSESEEEILSRRGTGRSLSKNSLPRRARPRTHVSLLLYVSCDKWMKQFSGGCLFICDGNYECGRDARTQLPI